MDKRGLSLDDIDPTKYERIRRVAEDIADMLQEYEETDEAVAALFRVFEDALGVNDPELEHLFYADEAVTELRELIGDVWHLSPNETVDFIRMVWRRAGLGKPPKIIFRRPRPWEGDFGAYTVFGDEIHVMVKASEEELQSGARVIRHLDVMHELAHIIAQRGMEGAPGNVLAAGREKHMVGHSESFIGILRALYHEIMGVPMDAMRVDKGWNDAWGQVPVFNEDVQTLQWARLNFMSKGGSAEEVYGDVNAPLEIFYHDDLGRLFAGSAVRPISETTSEWTIDMRQRFGNVRGLLRSFWIGGWDPGQAVRRSVDGPYKPHRSFSRNTPGPPSFDVEEGDPLQWIGDRAPQIQEGNRDVADD